ncbi:MAG: type II toxin-antitoxin system PemK/MazF family toxin [Tumebacillaceae bacterium]
MPNKKLLLEKYRTNPCANARQEGLFPEMMKTIGHLTLYLAEADLRRTVPLILWNEFWLERSQFPENHTRYKRGRLIYADLGAFNIGSETSYRHPCLILYEGRNWALVAPMTSKKYGDPVALHYDLPPTYRLDTPSTLQLDAIKVIDKRRILGYFYTKDQYEAMRDLNDPAPPAEATIIDKKDLDAIDELLARHYAPSLHKQLMHARYRQEQLELENQWLRQELLNLYGRLPQAIK